MSIFIITEIDINHNCEINICKHLIDLASKETIDAMKFQKRYIDSIYSKELLDGRKEGPWGKIKEIKK